MSGSRMDRARTESRRAETPVTPDPLDTAASVDDDIDPSPRREAGRDVGSTAVVEDRPRRRLVRGMSPKRAVLLAMVVSVVALTLAVPLRTYFSQQSESDQLAGANTSLRTEVSELQSKVDEQNDPAYIQAQARDRLQFVMPGDKAVVMQFPTPPAKSDEEKRAERRAGNAWYTNLLDSVSTPVDR
ncbi:MAG: septum formation initiator family protein [Corynebacteriales bacterium]|nr:septum formation initiator family protein [Mycobacteriales bacterium]